MPRAPCRRRAGRGLCRERDAAASRLPGRAKGPGASDGPPPAREQRAPLHREQTLPRAAGRAAHPGRVPRGEHGRGGAAARRPAARCPARDLRRRGPRNVAGRGRLRGAGRARAQSGLRSGGGESRRHRGILGEVPGGKACRDPGPGSGFLLAMSPAIRLTAVLTHPVQYSAPWFRHIAAHCPEIELTVLYATEPTPEQQGVGFGTAFAWDAPLTEGYACRVLRPARPGDSVHSGRFWGVNVPEMARAPHESPPDVALVRGW